MPSGVKISVEGGCGAGKTTLLNFLRSKWEKDQINFRDEPIGRECRQDNLKKTFFISRRVAKRGRRKSSRSLSQRPFAMVVFISN